MLMKDGEPTLNALRGPRMKGKHNHEQTVPVPLNITYSPLEAGFLDTLLLPLTLWLSCLIS